MAIGGSLDRNIDVSVEDGRQLDAFGRLRISLPTSLFDATFTTGVDSLVFDTSTATGGTVTHLPDLSSAQLGTTTTSGSSAIIQTRRYLAYQPGKSLLLKFTGNIGAEKSNVRKRAGFFDANNGVFFEQTGSGISVVVRTFTSGSPVDTAVAQTSWNINKMNGTGDSGVVLDFSKQLIFVIDFQWLGSGRVRFGFDVGGKIIYCHEVLNSNVLTVPFMTSAILPFRYELVNTGTAASSTTMNVTCMTVISEGGYEPNGILRYASNGTTTKTIGGTGTLVPILSLRKASSYAKYPVQLLSASLFANTIDDMEFIVFLNSGLTGASYSAVSGLCEIDVSATAITDGTPILGGYVRGASSAPSVGSQDDQFRSFNLILGSTIAGASDVITIAARNITATSNALASFLYKELV